MPDEIDTRSKARSIAEHNHDRDWRSVEHYAVQNPTDDTNAGVLGRALIGLHAENEALRDEVAEARNDARSAIEQATDGLALAKSLQERVRQLEHRLAIVHPADSPRG